MQTGKMWKIVILVAISALVLPRVYKFVIFQGFHVSVFNHYPGPCKRLPRIENGSEDMQLLSDNKVLITSGLQHPSHITAYEGVVGRIYLFDLEQPNTSPVEVTIQGDLNLDSFNPLGVTAWEDTQSGEVSVYIINVISTKLVTVECFNFVGTEKILYHTETIHNDYFIMLNNLVAVGPKQFYFTNYFNSLLEWELLLQLYRGNVGFYDGQNTQIVAEGLLMPNGIAMSPDGRYVYVSVVFDQQILIYSREKDNSLNLKETASIHLSADNLYVDQETGDLWAAGHPNIYHTLAHAADPKHTLSTSQVLCLHMTDGHMTDIQQVLVDDGRLHSASSVAIYKNKKLLIGSVFTSVLYCDVRYI